jgi:hypothetical protein
MENVRNVTISKKDSDYPARLRGRLRHDAPDSLVTIVDCFDAKKRYVDSKENP